MRMADEMRHRNTQETIYSEQQMKYQKKVNTSVYATEIASIKTNDNGRETRSAATYAEGNDHRANAMTKTVHGPSRNDKGCYIVRTITEMQ